MKGTDYQKKLEQLCKKRPSPGCHSATNAFRHIAKAWDIIDIDPDMAYFRAGCAEEEAATSIFHTLKRLKYPGASKLNHHRHHHKLAVIPFLWAVNTSFSAVHNLGLEPQVQITTEDSEEKIGVRFRIPGTNQLASPDPPLHFFTTDDGEKQTFFNELERLRAKSNLKTIADYLRKGANNRNLVLYAGADGIRQFQPGQIENFLEDQLLNVTKLLTIFLLIDTYSTKQFFVQQCLSAFLDMLGLLDEDSEFELPDF